MYDAPITFKHGRLHDYRIIDNKRNKYYTIDTVYNWWLVTTYIVNTLNK